MHFEMRGIPEFGLVIELHEDGMSCWRGAENGLAGEFLIESPEEFVHVDVGIRGGRRESEWRGRLGAFFVDDLFEAGEIGRICDADGAAFVAGD